MSATSPIQAGLPISRTPANRPTVTHVAREAATIVAQPPSAPMSLRYVRTTPMRVKGEATGREYIFSGSRPTQAIDPKDTAQLLSMGYFSRA